MNPKKYVRLEPDGIHWPDADVNDDLYYGIDFNNCINVSEGEEIIDVTWILEFSPDITTSDDFIEDNIVLVKINTVTIGTFKVICQLTTMLASRTEVQVAPMLITVY